MKKLNNYTNFSLLFNGIYLFGNCTNLLPDAINGLCCGLGLSLIFIGLFGEKYDLSKIRNYKKKILNKMILK